MNHRLVILQNCDFETPGEILSWAESRALTTKVIRADTETTLPKPDEFDRLVGLGSPKSPWDEDAWIVREIAFLENALAADKHVFGICFGAQLLARLLGAEIERGPESVIGWHETLVSSEGQSLLLAPERVPLFQWHGEFFDLPRGARSLGTSPLGTCDGFAHGKRVIGVSAHLEITPELVETYLRVTGLESAPAGRWTQSPRDMRASTLEHHRRSREFAFATLDAWSGA